MKGFGRQFGLLALCLCLLCLPITTAFAAPTENCPGNCTHQAAIAATHYDTLAEALTAATDGCTVTVLADIPNAAGFTIGKAITLDLNGKTITGQKDNLFTLTKDLTVKNGTLSAKAVCLSAKNCNVTVEEKVTLISKESNTIEMSGSGKLTITGGEFQAKKHAVLLNIPKSGMMEAAISKGTFTTEKEPFLIQKDTDAIAPESFVTGGTYNQDPSAYMAKHCGLIRNNDGTYTVVTAYTLTFQAGGASGIMTSVSVPCGESYQLPKCGYTPAQNMEFAGWVIDGKTYGVGAVFTPTSNTIITAQWKAHEHFGGSATCLSPAICTGCGSAYGQYGSHSLTYSGGYAATCSSTGMTAHSKCSTCGVCFVDGNETSSFSLSTPALGHQWKTEKAKAATCTEAGCKEYKICSTCGSIQIAGKEAKKEDTVIPAAGHTLVVVEATQSSCTQSGVQSHEQCTTCNKLFQQKKEIQLDQITTALSSHVLGEKWLSDESGHWKTCVDCEAVFRRNVHTDTNADGLCDDCSYQMAAETVAPTEDDSGFSWVYLIPVAAAVAISATMAIRTIKKRK